MYESVASFVAFTLNNTFRDWTLLNSFESSAMLQDRSLGQVSQVIKILSKLKVASKADALHSHWLYVITFRGPIASWHL